MQIPCFRLEDVSKHTPCTPQWGLSPSVLMHSNFTSSYVTFESMVCRKQTTDHLEACNARRFNSKSNWRIIRDAIKDEFLKRVHVRAQHIVSRFPESLNLIPAFVRESLPPWWQRPPAAGPRTTYGSKSCSGLCGMKEEVNLRLANALKWLVASARIA